MNDDYNNTHDSDSADFDVNSAIEQIQSMMSTDDGQSKLNNIINAFVGSDDNENQNQSQNSGNGFSNPLSGGGMPDMNQMESMLKIGKIMSSIKSQQDSASTNLLYAIKPFLRKSRQEKTDSAIKLMGMVKAFALLKDSGINLDF